MMMAVFPQLAGTPSVDRDGVIPSELMHRLLRASANDVPMLVSDLSERQRAHLAFFCYGRAHLHATGLAIAATCDLPSLIAAAPSNGAATALYAQSREGAKRAERPATNGRRPITLAKSVSDHRGLARIIALAADDEPELETIE
jgi:hypothetical protein